MNMAQQIVTIRIQEAEDGTKSARLDQEEITLNDGDTLVFRATAAAPLTDGAPQIVFANAPAPLDTAVVNLQVEGDPLAPVPPASDSENEIVIDANIPAGDYDYTVQIAGAVLASGRIKIIRQQ
jgi:hypothetical protein